MSATLFTNWDFQRYETDVERLFAESTSPLEGTCRIKEIPGATTINIPTLSQGFDTDRGGVHGDIPNTEGDEGTVPITSAVKFYRAQIDDENKFRTEVDIQQGHIENGREVFNRRRSLFQVDALVASTPTIIAQGGTGLTLAKIQAVARLFERNNVPKPWHWATSPDGLYDMINIASVTGNFPIFIGSDFKPPVNLANPVLQGVEWHGFRWVTSTLLPKTVTIRSTFAWGYKAIMGARQITPTTMIERDARSDSWLITMKIAMGFSVIQAAGTVQVDIVENVIP